jgi:C-terminal processing protease CtpA/Prc
MKRCLLVFFLTYSCWSFGQNNTEYNFSFENKGKLEKLPSGWKVWGGYDIETDSVVVYSGKKSISIASGKNKTDFGSTFYSIPAAKYQGNQIRLEGYMRTLDIKDGHAGLLLRIDGKNESLVFDNMENQSINGTTNWKKYTINLPYPDGAELIIIGGIIVGTGTAWFDDFTLMIDGQNIKTMKEVRLESESDKEFDNGSGLIVHSIDHAELELVGRVWGFLKYHHPIIASGKYNWDYELFRFFRKYLDNRNSIKISDALSNWVDSIGVLKICDKCAQSSPEALLKPDMEWMRLVKEPLLSKLKFIYTNRVNDKNVYINLAPYIGNPEFTNENKYAEMPFPDQGFRLLALYRYWNMIHYFFPYKNLTDKNWNEVLREYIPEFINAKDELDYELAALRIIGEVNDSHANLWGGNEKVKIWKGDNYCPFRVEFVEGKLVVTDYYNPELKTENGPEVGDIITTINGIAIENLTESMKMYFPSSNPASRMRDMAEDILRSGDSLLNISYMSNGNTRSKYIKLHKKEKLNIYRWYKEISTPSYKWLKAGIGYVTLQNIKLNDIDSIKTLFKDARGIVIDIRNYPSTFVPFALGSYFVASTTPFVKFTTGSISNPGEFTFGPPINIPKGDKTFNGKLVILLNEKSQSQAEYTAMAFRAGKNTTIIGSVTAGADGNVSSIYLPGNLRTMISGIGVFYPDGKKTQRVGIIPDIIIKPTIAGIKTGKDEVLLAAIEFINR